jgi:hypothetical protein
MEARSIGLIALIGGLLLGFGSVLLDYTGLTATPELIGGYQWIGVTAGSILFMLGLMIVLYAEPDHKDA